VKNTIALASAVRLSVDVRVERSFVCSEWLNRRSARIRTSKPVGSVEVSRLERRLVGSAPQQNPWATIFFGEASSSLVLGLRLEVAMFVQRLVMRSASG